MLIGLRGGNKKVRTTLTYCALAVLALTMSATAGEPQSSTAAKAELKWQPFEQGFAEAQKNDKKVMLDVYTDWCGWCKRLDRDVYSDKRVVSYLNKHYVVVKLNAEDTTKVSYKDKTTSKVQLAGGFGVRGYPTIIFFGSNGDPINSLPGYVDADKFLTVVKYIGEDYYKKITWENFQKMEGSNSSKK